MEIKFWKWGLSFTAVRVPERGNKLRIMIAPIFKFRDEWGFKHWWFVNLPF